MREETAELIRCLLGDARHSTLESILVQCHELSLDHQPALVVYEAEVIRRMIEAEIEARNEN